MVKIPRARIGGLLAEITKARYTVRMIPYPQKRNAWMIEIITDGGKANVRIPLAGSDLNRLSVRELIGTVKIGGKRALYNISRAVGAIGEAKLKARLLRGGMRIPNSAPPPDFFDNASFTDVFSIQNRSGHGIDMVAKMTDPPPPRWVAFEAKSRMETPTFPSLSAQQQEAADFILKRAERAKNGIERFRRTGGAEGGTWRDLAAQRQNVDDFFLAARRNEVISVFAKIDLDRNGNQIGDIITEVWGG